MLKRNLWVTFDETEKKAERAAAVMFAFLKKKKIINPGIPRKDVDDETIERLSKELERDVSDIDDSKIGMSDVEKLGGMTPRFTGHSEDESIYY